jgi:hypothetical protein
MDLLAAQRFWGTPKEALEQENTELINHNSYRREVEG